MSQKFTLFLPDGTPLRADVSVKTGLPPSLAPSALATHYSVSDGVVHFGDGITGARPPAGSAVHAGGMNVALADGSVRMFQPNQPDLAFLTNRAGRTPLEQLSQSGPGALFLNCQGSPHCEVDNFLARLEFAIKTSRRAIKQLKIVANPAPIPKGPAPSSSPGARVVPSQIKVLTLSPAPPGLNLRDRSREPGRPAPPAAINRLAQGFEKTFNILNVFPAQFGGLAAKALQSSAAVREEITLSFEELRIS